MAPIVVAAFPITDKMKAPELEKLTRQILYGLLDQGIRLVSAGCDGTETERGVQRLLISHAESTWSYMLPSPTNETDVYRLTVEEIGRAHV